MKLLSRNEISDYTNKDLLKISNLKFIDGYRIGLSLHNIYYKVNEPVDLLGDIDCKSNILSPNYVFAKGNLYLLESKQQLCVPENIFGLIQTRSKFARLGFELAQSSLIIIPGFGKINPTPLVLEFSPRIDICGIKTDEFYGYVIFFEIDSNNSNNKDYRFRFPFNKKKQPPSKVSK